MIKFLVQRWIRCRVFCSEDLHLEGRQTCHFAPGIRLSFCNLIILGKPLSHWERAFKLFHIQENFKKHEMKCFGSNDS